MARQTRQQRRARRQAQAESAQQRPAARPRVRSLSAAPAEETALRPSGIPGIRFLHESWGELKKVEWPGQQQVIAGTVVVLVACLIVGVYLYVNDIVWKHVVQNFLLK